MELIEVKNKIESKVNDLEKIRSVILERSIKKARATSDYERSLSLVIIKLKNGQAMVLDGEEIISPPASVMEKIAKGICWEYKLKMDEAEAMYKSAVSNLDAVKAELNGLQTLNKYFE